MPDLIGANEIFFTPFEPKTKNRFIMEIEGVPSFLIRAANRPSIEFEEIELNQGDSIVQNGTRHRWHNRADIPAVLITTCIGSERKKE